jgi:alpha-glucoside transport system permease protein
MSSDTRLPATAPPTTDTGAGKRRASSFDTNPAKAGWLTKLVLALICFLWIVPVLGTFITSFRTVTDAESSGWWRFLGSVGNLTLDNYREALSDRIGMGDAFINSFAITLPATFIPIMIAAFAAYAFTFMEFKGRDILFLSIVALLVVPNYVALVPILQIYSAYEINGTFASAWLFHLSFAMPLAIYILRNYMATLPKTVIESAKIDGATHFQTFFRLILPMSVPALASFAIFQFLWVWNDLLVALVFIGPGSNEPMTVAATELQGQLGQGWNLVAAGGFLTMIVPIIVFLALQRFFVRGMTAGAVKG